VTAPDFIIAAGHRYSLLAAALIKKCLEQKLPNAERLHYLEMLDSMIDTYITPEMLAVVQPLSDQSFQFIEEADKLSAPDDKLAKAKFDLLTSDKIFDWFVQLNPSLLGAIKFREGQYNVGGNAPSAKIAEPEQPQPEAVPYGQDIPDRLVARRPSPQTSRTFNLHTGQ
jgi:hypothetical protein